MTLAARKIRLILELRGAGVADTAVLAAVERVPREAFVPAAFQDQAYENLALPLGHGQSLTQPQVCAAMAAALGPDKRLKLLEIGTGSGYLTAVLAQLFRRVYTVERSRALLADAEARFAALRLHNVTARLGDGARGWPAQAPFPRILLAAAVPQVPVALADQLGEAGVLVLPLGKPGREQRLLRLTREAAGFQEKDLGPVRFLPLVEGAPNDSRIAAESQDSGRRHPILP